MDGADPFAFLQSSGRELFILLVLVPLAVAAFWYGSRAFRRARGESSLRPSGRPMRDHRAARGKDWKIVATDLERADVSRVADATRGPVRIEGEIVAASGNLGGRPGRECVWRNRAGARPQSAVGAELVVVSDGTGRVGVEGLEAAHVVTPSEPHSRHHESVSLYLGDVVEIMAHFEPEQTDKDGDPTELVYGTLSARSGGLDVRLVRRPPHEQPKQDREDPQ